MCQSFIFSIGSLFGVVVVGGVPILDPFVFETTNPKKSPHGGYIRGTERKSK